MSRRSLDRAGIYHALFATSSKFYVKRPPTGVRVVRVYGQHREPNVDMIADIQPAPANHKLAVHALSHVNMSGHSTDTSVSPPLRA